MPQGLDDYASPILRCAVFRRLYPGAQIGYNVVPIGRAFPDGHFEYEGKATEAVKCEIIFADGSYIVAFKEIDKRDRGKDVQQTPEQMAKDETKALGRAMRDAGIPQRLSELKLLMQWIASMETAGSGRLTNGDLKAAEVANGTRLLGEAFPGSTEITEDDAADAGADEPTTEQLLAKRFAFLDGPAKMLVVRYARDELGVQNVMRAGDKAEALLAYIDAGQPEGWSGTPTPVDPGEAALAHDVKAEAKRVETAASILPDEEPF